MNGKIKAIEILKKHEGIIRQKYGVKKIGVFGLFARGEEKDGSDVDVLVEFEDDFENFDNYIELKYFLEDLFGRNVDLVTFEALRPQLKEVILREVAYE
jgi:predicted nucleotidyltransferase